MPFIAAPVALVIVASIALSVVASLLFPPRRPQPQQPQQPAAPKPADGKFNFKQNVPSLPIVLGQVKKGGDYVFLEERAGTVWHVIVMAGHRIEGFDQHYLHDEPVSKGGDNWVTSPPHFGFENVRITTKLGTDIEDAWTIYFLFPTIWTVDHRGDGLAQVLLQCNTVSQDRYLDVYPQQMPVHTAVMKGALVYDPRREDHDPDDPATWTYTGNLALLRLHQLTQPWGGKLGLADMHLPDWAHAADICDETITNGSDGHEPRYWGGLWFRAENDQVEIGRKLDEAAELVLYERADGLIGVHAGEMVTPDITIGEDDILAFHYDANRRAATTVLAVRGRWTDPSNAYNTADAAIWGDPYVSGDDSQRSKTFDNDVVQSHNHCQRKQKLTFIRANAPSVALTIPYVADGPSRNVAYRRFIRVNYPARGLDNAIVEITGRPKLSLRNLTISLEGIVVPSTLYSFDAATEEGAQGGAAGSLTPEGVPVPTGFTVGIASETLAGGQSAAFALAAWDFLSDALTYELEYQKSDLSAAARRVMSVAGDTEVRTPPLEDGVEYRFALRAVSNRANSDWTADETATASADTAAPGQPTGFATTPAGSAVTLDWVNPNSPNLYRTVVYRNSVNNFATAAPIFIAYGGIAAARTYTDSGLAAGTYYWWLRSFNASGVGGTQVGPESETI